MIDRFLNVSDQYRNIVCHHCVAEHLLSVAAWLTGASCQSLCAWTSYIPAYGNDITTLKYINKHGYYYGPIWGSRWVVLQQDVYTPLSEVAVLFMACIVGHRYDKGIFLIVASLVCRTTLSLCFSSPLVLVVWVLT